VMGKNVSPAQGVVLMWHNFVFVFRDRTGQGTNTECKHTHIQGARQDGYGSFLARRREQA